MANHSPAWCMCLLLGGWGGHRPAYVLQVWNNVHLSKHSKRNASVFMLHWQKERWWRWSDGRDILLSRASRWNAPLCFSRSPYVRSVSSHTNRNCGTPKGHLTQSRTSKTLQKNHQRTEISTAFIEFTHARCIWSCMMCKWKTERQSEGFLHWFWSINQENSVICWDLCVSSTAAEKNKMIPNSNGDNALTVRTKNQSKCKRSNLLYCHTSALLLRPRQSCLNAHRYTALLGTAHFYSVGFE